MKAIFRYLVALSLIVQALGHGRLIDPASRNAAWRYGFDTPTQVTDNELNCGGFSTQWDKNGGKCGVCGDPYHFKEGEAMYTHTLGNTPQVSLPRPTEKARRLK